MDSLTENMAQQEILLHQVREELRTTKSRLDADTASAKETHASLAQAKQKLADQHNRLLQNYEEAVQDLTQLVKKAQHLMSGEEAQILTTGPEISKSPLDKTIGDYIEEGLTNKLKELSEQNTDTDLSHLRHTLPILTKDLDASVNKKALARLTSPRPHFIPTKVISCFISNADYSALRKLYDFKGFKNLKTLRYDREKFIQGLKCFGLKEEDIEEYRDMKNSDEMRDILNRVHNQCKQNAKDGEKTLVLFSYGGHGIQFSMTYALCNTTERKKIACNLEEKLRLISGSANTFVVAFFDCCREQMSKADIHYGKSATSGGPSRGGSSTEHNVEDQKQDVDDEKYADDGKPRNFIAIFGCKPGDQTPADSKLIVQFFQKVVDMSEEEDHIVLLPGSLSAWKPNNKGEVLSFTTHDLVIPFDHTASPECFSHQADLKQKCIDEADKATEDKAKKQQAIEKGRFMFADFKTDTILCYTESTGEWKTLRCYDANYVSYTRFATCHIDRSKLFQLGGDRTCQMLIPDTDPQILKFTVEKRVSHPYKAGWDRATLIAFPEDSFVLVCGLKWDAGMLNPWRYNYLDNKWSYKCSKEEDSPPIPALPCERKGGSGCRLGQAVYLFCGQNEESEYVEHIDRMDLRTWSSWQQIQTPQTEEMGRLAPFVQPLNETDILIIGGYDGEISVEEVQLFSTETNETTQLDDSGFASRNIPYTTVLTSESGQILGLDACRYGRMLIQVTRDGSSGAVSAMELKKCDDAENRVTSAPPEYDSNYVLNIHGMKELAKEQKPLYDQWWELLFSSYENGLSDSILELMQIQDQDLQVKRIYAQHAGMEEGKDPSEYTKIELNEQQQRAFLTATWLYARQTYEEDETVEEPADELAAKMKAIQSLSQGESTTFSWKDFKRAYKMMKIWFASQRVPHTRRVREAAAKTP